MLFRWIVWSWYAWNLVCEYTLFEMFVSILYCVNRGKYHVTLLTDFMNISCISIRKEPFKVKCPCLEVFRGGIICLSFQLGSSSNLQTCSTYLVHTTGSSSTWFGVSQHFRLSFWRFLAFLSEGNFGGQHAPTFMLSLWWKLCHWFFSSLPFS